MKLTERKVATELRRHGYKVTPQRRVVIRVITAKREHLTPAAIYERVHHEQSNIGLVTVYRTIELLDKLGLICKLYDEDGGCSYIISAPGHHHHLVCSGCGKVVALTVCQLEAAQQSLSRQTGFKIDGHRLEFTGLCRACQSRSC